MTEQSQQGSQPGEELPRRRGALPQREPGLPQRGESLPQREPGLPQHGDALPQRGEGLPQRGEALPQRGESLPQREPGLPQLGDALPQRGESLPQRGDAVPQRGEGLPQRGERLPQREPGLPQRGDALPQRGESLPQQRSGDSLSSWGEQLPRRGELPQRDGSLPFRGEPLPQRTGSGAGALPQRNSDALPQRNGNGLEPLPRRTTRTRPAGRHRSPHRLSVAKEAPALVLAVPGTAESDIAQIGPHVADIAALSCPGVDIRVGYLEGGTQLASDCLLSGSSGPDDFPTVIVPLLLSPSPKVDAVVRELAAQPVVPTVLADHLGPHPLVAEALHTRLADAGLARHARAAGLSISADSRGIVVLADVGEEAASAAAVAAVLLASRLSVPVMPASLGDPASIVEAVTRLSESGAARPALAPCLIGPETSQEVLDDLSAALSAPSAPVLGAHQAIGQLVAIRYGAALASLSLAG